VPENYDRLIPLARTWAQQMPAVYMSIEQYILLAFTGGFNAITAT
jgi:hypothetical protein